jgi:FG-GAP repeat
MRGSTGSTLISLFSALVVASRSFSQPLSFVAPREFDVGEQPASIAVADFNRDGVNDLAVVISPPPAAGAQGVAIMLGVAGGFGTPQIVYRGTAADLAGGR